MFPSTHKNSKPVVQRAYCLVTFVSKGRKGKLKRLD